MPSSGNTHEGYVLDIFLNNFFYTERLAARNARKVSKSEPYLTESQVETLLSEFSAGDWHKATSCASIFCVNLPGLTAKDLLHEAIVQLLDGTRHCPQNIKPMTALYFVMRSIASHLRKRMKDGPIDYRVEVISDFDEAEEFSNAVIPVSLASPETNAQDRQLIADIEKLFVDDPEVRRLLHLWAEGIFGGEARLEMNMSRNMFEAANKRLRRKLAAHKIRSA